MIRLFRLGVFGILTLAIVGAAAPWAHGQGLTGQIGGTVLDNQKAAIPGGTVTARNSNTQVVRDAVTDAQGVFVITNILAGTYEIRVTLTGFKPYVQRGVVVSSTERVALPPITLEVGGVSEEVSVQADAVRVQTQSGERSATIGAEQIEDVGLRGRDFMGLLKVLPGVVDSSARDAPGWGTVRDMTINGQSSFNFSYDGVTNKDTGSNSGNYAAPALDSIAEVKVQASNFQAEYGRSSGATIIVVTKSGSSRFSGSVAYYRRNEDFNANSWDRRRSCDAAKVLGTVSANCEKAPYRYDNTAYTLGGPILVPGTSFNLKRDKLFFFWSQDLLPRVDPQPLQNSTMPTARERLGDFSQTVDNQNRLRFIRDPLRTGTCNINTGGAACFPGNVIPTNRIDPFGQAMLNLFPLPNTTDPTGSGQYNYQWSTEAEKLRRDQVLRVDWNVRPGTTFYTRLQFGHEIYARGFATTGTNLGAQTNWPQMRNSYDINTLGTVNTLLHTFNATTVLELTAGLNGSEQLVYAVSQADLDANDRTKVLPGLQQFFPEANPLNIIPNMSFAGTNALPNTRGMSLEPRYPFTARNPTSDYSANLTHLRGNHNLKAGLFYEHTARPASRISTFNGSYNFNGNASNPWDTNFGFANAILGSINNYTESTAHPYAEGRFNQFEFFAQDNWRLNRKWTLDYGMRFVYNGPTYVAGQEVAYFDKDAFSTGKAPRLYEAVCSNRAATCTGTLRVAQDPARPGVLLDVNYIGKLVPGSGDFSNGMALREGTVPAYEGFKLRPSPRVGFAWDVFGDGKTAVRGGYGITYDRYSDDDILALVEQPPLMDTRQTNWVTMPQLLGAQLIQNPRAVNAFTPYKPLMTHAWSLGMQRELPFKLVGDIAWVGNTQRNVSRNIPINDLTPAQLVDNRYLDPTQNNTQRISADFVRPYQGYAGINERQYFEDGVTYNSLQASVTRRLSSGLAMSFAYTNARSYGLRSWDWYRTEADNRSRNTNASGSRPHNLVIGYNYLVPGVSRFLGDYAVVAGVLDGWQLSGVSTFQSGSKSGFSYGFTGAPAGDLTQGLGGSRVSLVCDPNLPRSERTFDRQFRTECIQAPGPFTDAKDTLYQGNSLGDEWINLGYMNHDITLFKNFPLPRRRNIQIRVEMYNAFNWTQYSGVDTGAVFDYATGAQTDTNFGRVTGVRGSSNRVIQLGSRFTF